MGSRNHGNKIITQLFKELERLGFNVIHARNNTFKIVPPQDLGGRIYSTHGTPKAYKALLAYYRKTYGIKLDSKN